MTEEHPRASKTTNGPEEPSEKAPKRVEQVVTTEVVERKVPLSRRFKKTFVIDRGKNVLVSVCTDILVPALQGMLADTARAAIEGAIYGDKVPPRYQVGGGAGSQRLGNVNYNMMSKPGRPTTVQHTNRSVGDFSEFVIQDRGEAVMVLRQLEDALIRYKIVSVADLKDMLGVTGTYVDDGWGWTDISGAQVARVRGGYVLDLPRPSPIN